MSFGKISRLFCLALVVIIMTLEAAALGSAVLSEVKNQTEPIKETIMLHDERYPKENLAYIASKYRVDPEYIDYIRTVEETFGLIPYELMALIAKESGFLPLTRMDAGSLSYNSTQMKLATAKTAYMAITQYYKHEIPFPTDQLMKDDKHYTALLAGGYLKYLHETYGDRHESYTAYRYGIGGRQAFYQRHGHYRSPYAQEIEDLIAEFSQSRPINQE